jgi:glycosyltransferase involved in cell wall biosynthesis
LMITGFTFLLMIHITLIISRLSEQNKEIIQELGIVRLGTAPKKADLLIIVPAYNEAQSIVKVIEDLRGPDLEMDILVVNDGSIDSTSSAAKATGEAMVIDLPKNLGIGGAVQTGFKYAARNNYKVAIQFDGDGQHIAEEIPKLLSTMAQDGANMVIGSRFLEKHTGFRSTFMRRWGIRLFEGLNSMLIRQRITDNTSGFRAYDRRAIEFLALYYTVDYPEPETVILLGRNHFKISEVSTKMRERLEGKSSFAGSGDYYMIKVLLAVIMTALRKPIIEKNSK